MSLHTSCYTFKPRSKKSFKSNKIWEKTIYLPWPFPVQIDKITKKNNSMRIQLPDYFGNHMVNYSLDVK